MKMKSYCAFLSFCLAPWAQAHHGVANFDLNKDIELTGKITRVRLINPHSWLHFDVTNADGSVTPWRCEMRGVTVLRRSGWSKEMFPAGMEVNISASPDRRDPAACYLSTITFPDGTFINRYGQIEKPKVKTKTERALRLANGNPNIAGDWAAEQLVMTDPSGKAGMLVPLSISKQFQPGEVPGGGPGFPGSRGTSISLEEDPVDAYWNQRPSTMQLTTAGSAAMAPLDLSTGDNPRLRCSPTNILFDWYFEMDVNRIEQTSDQIKIYYGSNGIERTIHLNANEHPKSIEPSLSGHSIGHWENDALIVDTVSFKPGILNADQRIPHSENLHIVERFSLNTDTMALQRRYVAEDPSYFVGQFTGSDTMFISDLPYHGTTECEEPK